MASAIVLSALLVAIFAFALVMYYHPGTQYPYLIYLPGLLAAWHEKTVTTHTVAWHRSEVPADTINSKRGFARPPNVVIIIADDLGYNDLSGGMGALTPNIDRLRDSGVQFSQAYSSHATCSPARAGLLTGRIPNRFGYESLAVPVSLSWTVSMPSEGNVRQPVFHYELMNQVPDIGDMVIPSSERMISDVLKTANYSLVYIGKWHLGKRSGMKPQDHFDEYLGFLGGASMYMWPTNDAKIVNGHLDDPLDRYLWANLKDHVQHNNNESRFSPNEYMTDYLGKQAAAAIRTKLQKPSADDVIVPPMLMIVAFNAPHTPLQATVEDFNAPELQHITSHNERVYAAMIRSLDRSVGYITEAIASVGEENNTIVVFTSDNGGPGYVGIQDMNKPLRGWKATFFEGGIRVPMFMSWPGTLPAHLVYGQPVSHCDIFSTVASAAHIDVPAVLGDVRAIDGVNLLPYLLTRGDSSAVVYADQCPSSEMACSRSRETSRPHDTFFWRTGKYLALRHLQWKLQASYRPDKVWLNNIEADISEKVNFAEGVRWTVLEKLVGSNATKADCFSAMENVLIMNPFPTPFVNTESSVDMSIQQRAELVCSMGDKLATTHQELSAPLWPSLTEVPMPIDHADAGVKTLEEEYVYWFL